MGSQLSALGSQPARLAKSPPLHLFVRRDHHRHAVPLHIGVGVLGGADFLDVGQQAVEDGAAESPAPDVQGNRMTIVIAPAKSH